MRTQIGTEEMQGLIATALGATEADMANLNDYLLMENGRLYYRRKVLCSHGDPVLDRFNQPMYETSFIPVSDQVPASASAETSAEVK